MSDETFLPYARPVIDDDDIAAVTRVLKSGWLTTGPEVEAFERELAATVGARHAVACANGTAALHLVSMALGIGPGDVVIVPAVTFLATANAPALCGARIVFADVGPETGRMTAATLEEAFARACVPVKAAFNVHLAGPCEDAAAIGAVAEAHGAVLVDDACHALGTRYVACGAEGTVGDARFARAAVFSFHAVKTIAMGEGGAVTTNDAALADAMRLARNHGMTRDPARFAQTEEAFSHVGTVNPWYYEMAAPGFNYRVSDLQCALGRSQLVKLDRFVSRRARLKAAYDAAFASRGLDVWAPVAAPHCSPAWHLYPARIDFDRIGVERAEVIARLAASGVGAQVHYLPLHRQPFYRGGHDAARLAGADAYYARTLSLPLYPAMTDADVERVVDAAADALSSRGRKSSVRSLGAARSGACAEQGPDIVLRADAAPKLGGGHVMRLLTLARALERRGARCRMAVNQGAEDAVPALAAASIERIALAKSDDFGELAAKLGGRVDALVIDHYGLDAAYESRARDIIRAVVAIDDLADRPHAVDLLIDSSPGRQSADYNGLMRAPGTVLAGPAYALLRPEFASRRDEALGRRRRAGSVRRALVSLGLTDVGGVTEIVTRSLAELDLDVEFDVVLPRAAPSRSAVKALCARDRRFRLVEEGADMADLMARADLAIGAGGQTSLERACLGLPSVLVVLADNQRGLARALSGAGACVVARIEEDAEAVAAAVLRLAGDAAARMAMTLRAVAIVDGKGADRAADAILRTLQRADVAA